MSSRETSIETLATNPEAKQNAWANTAAGLWREMEMLGLGVGQAATDAVVHPMQKLPQLGLSLAIGAGLGTIARLGAPGAVIAAGIGTAMAANWAYDELTGKRWSTFGHAVADAWRSGDHLDRDIAATRDSLGSFIVDTAVGYAGFRGGSFLTSGLAPPSMLVKDAIARSERDGGAALKGLQDRFENSSLFEKQVAGKLELTTYSAPMVVGAPTGDVLKVSTTPDGNILMSSMDVQGHGISAARKAVQVHTALDRILPQTSGKSAADVLSMVDQQLPTKDELAVAASAIKYNPDTHELQTATAGGQQAWVVRNGGAVERLGQEGGVGLGVELHQLVPSTNDVTFLGKGDTVVMGSDGFFDRFGFGDLSAVEQFLKDAGPNPKTIGSGILSHQSATGADDTSFMIFRRLT